MNFYKAYMNPFQTRHTSIKVESLRLLYGLQIWGTRPTHALHLVRSAAKRRKLWITVEEMEVCRQACG